MSADALRTSFMAELEKLAGEAATSQSSISIAQTCEQIALQTAGFKGAILAYERCARLINQEFKKLNQPEEVEKPVVKKKDIY